MYINDWFHNLLCKTILHYVTVLSYIYINLCSDAYTVFQCFVPLRTFLLAKLFFTESHTNFHWRVQVQVDFDEVCLLSVELITYIPHFNHSCKVSAWIQVPMINQTHEDDGSLYMLYVMIYVFVTIKFCNVCRWLIYFWCVCGSKQG